MGNADLAPGLAQAPRALAPNAPDKAAANPHVRIDALDGVRGIAILLVLVHHMAQSLQLEFSWKNPVLFQWLRPVFGAARLGWAGVDLFLVLSGFLITGILVDAKGKDRYFLNFYARRTLRIFPLYYLALIALIVLRQAWPSGEFYPVESQAWLWLYLTNVIITLKGYGSFAIVDHFWSLAVEEQFYLIWPFIVRLFSRETLMKVAGGAIVTALVVRTVLVLTETYSAGAYVLMPARMDALAAGSLVALAARGPGGISRLKPWATKIGITAAVCLLGILAWRQTVKHDDPIVLTLGMTGLSALFASGLVLSVTYGPIRRIVSAGVLRWFGKYSYGIYVWHPLVFLLVMHSEAARRFRDGADLSHLIVSVLLSVALTAIICAISWTLVERQFLKLKRFYE